VTPFVFAKQHAHPFTFASQGFIVLPDGRHIFVMAGSRAVKNSVATARSMSSLLKLLTAASRPNFLHRCMQKEKQEV
jgi:translation initiation factor 2B subunit (eIF-2B alpha/beta/delta family)